MEAKFIAEPPMNNTCWWGFANSSSTHQQGRKQLSNMNLIPFTAMIHARIHDALNQFFKSGQNGNVAADVYLYLMMLERLRDITFATSELIARFEVNRNADFAIEILLRPFTQDYLLFKYFEITVKSEIESLSDPEKIIEVHRKTAMHILSDGMQSTISHINKLTPDKITSEKNKELKAIFSGMFHMWFDDAGNLKKDYGSNIKMSDVIEKLSQHQHYDYLLKVYEDFHMIFSKKEHFGIVGSKMAQETSDQDKLLTYFACTGDMFAHIVNIIDHLKGHLNDQNHFKIFQQEMKSIWEIFKPRAEVEKSKNKNENLYG